MQLKTQEQHFKETLTTNTTEIHIHTYTHKKKQNIIILKN